MWIQDKISGMMARPGQDPVAKDDVPWMLKFAGRSLGTVGGFLAILLGMFNATGLVLGFSVMALISGMWQMVAGFILLCIEAPCCCMFIDHVQRLSDLMENRPYWNRAAGYVLLALPAIFMDAAVSIIVGSGLIFATGVIYGMMALGRKATAEEMRQAAAADAANSRTTDSSGMRSNLVANAQPISFTGAPVFDKNGIIIGSNGALLYNK